MSINKDGLNLSQLKIWQEKPAPFTPGEALFWDDPHISTQMLSAHLDTENDLASRRPEIIDRSVRWIIESLNLHPKDKVLDLGCGPGLYASRFAQMGIDVTGIDYSKRSIEYATNFAREQNLNIKYRYQNYLELTDVEQYDVALLIYGDFCPLSPEQRAQLLHNVHRALKPKGHFVFDVSTRNHRKHHTTVHGWEVVESGFWKSEPHLLLEQGFDYPEQSIYLNQTITLEGNGKLSVYRRWFQDYTPETISKELETGGFLIKSIWSDLTGKSYKEDTEWIGVIVQKN
ncbi:MAG: class I SAM-dependent methyltransferase [Anaerolineales bacterium]